MRFVACLILLSFATTARCDELARVLLLIEKPDAFPTLVNPNCSHCRDEATLRAGDLRPHDRVLCWIRGYSNGGAIPHRFFLNKWRVISDSYGVFVYDSDGGYVRGYAPSYEFTFHGWRNGVMVMQRSDGTLFSCLTGEAFAGPGKGSRLETVATLPSDWGYWLQHYPEAVAYRMYDKYQAIPMESTVNEDSVKTRIPLDARLPADDEVVGVWTGKSAKAYPLSVLAQRGFIADTIDGESLVVFWEPKTRTAAAYRPVASQPRKYSGPNPDKNGVSPPNLGTPLPEGSTELPPKSLTLEYRPTDPANMAGGIVLDQETQSHWDIAGRGIDGNLKSWTLTWVDSTQVKWFAWAAEYPQCQIFGHSSATADFQPLNSPRSNLAPPLGNQDVTLRQFAVLKSIDAERHRLTLQIEGETELKECDLEPGAEVWHAGWWGRLDQFSIGDRVCVWFSNHRNQTSTLSLLADELSEQNFYGSARIESVAASEPGRSSVSLKLFRGGKSVVKTLILSDSSTIDSKRATTSATLNPGDKCFFQSNEDETGKLWSPIQFESQRTAQMKILEQLWMDEGLPGIVAFRHQDSSLVDIMLDHESMFWGRTLRPGDRVTMVNGGTFSATVKQLRPWRERTQVLLQLDSADSTESMTHSRVYVKVASVPSDLRVDEPPGLDRPRTAAERVDWLMSGIYCTCGMHDMCAGHFYTLAACDSFGTNPCGLAKTTRENMTQRVNAGQSDRKIFDDLLKERGPKLVRPHLSP